MVRQEFVMLADGAEAVNGKIYILGGGVERHLAPGFPTLLKADIALGILVGWAETNTRHTLGVRMVDEDEKVAFSLDGEFETGRPPGAKPGQDFRTLIALRGPFPIQEPGAYKVVINLDGAPQDPPFRFWVEHAGLPAGAAPAAG